MSKNLVSIRQFNPEHSVGKGLNDSALQLNDVILGHTVDLDLLQDRGMMRSKGPLYVHV